MSDRSAKRRERRKRMSDRWARRRERRERERWHSFHPPNVNQTFHYLRNPPFAPKIGEAKLSAADILHFVVIVVLAVILTKVLVALVAWLLAP